MDKWEADGHHPAPSNVYQVGKQKIARVHLFESDEEAINQGLRVVWDSTSSFLQRLPMRRVEYTKVDLLRCILTYVEVKNVLLEKIEKGSKHEGNFLTEAVISKAKSICRRYEDFIINGDSSEHHTQLDGLKKLANDKGVIKDFKEDGLNNFIMQDKYDFIYMSHQLFRTYRDTALYPAIPYGASSYLGVPIYVTDLIEDEFIPENIWQKCRQWLSTKVKWIRPYKANYSTVYLGKFDDGSMTKGISGIYGGENILKVESVGTHPSKDADIYRIKGYLGLAVFNEDDIVKVKVRLKA